MVYTYEELEHIIASVARNDKTGKAQLKKYIEIVRRDAATVNLVENQFHQYLYNERYGVHAINDKIRDEVSNSEKPNSEGGIAATKRAQQHIQEIDQNIQKINILNVLMPQMRFDSTAFQSLPGKIQHFADVWQPSSEDMPTKQWEDLRQAQTAVFDTIRSEIDRINEILSVCQNFRGVLKSYEFRLADLLKLKAEQLPDLSQKLIRVLNDIRNKGAELAKKLTSE